MIRYGLLLAAFVATPALADGTNTGPDREVIHIGMRVPALCVLGDTVSGAGEFDMGTLSDRTSGLLRRDLSAPEKRLVSSFCNAPSIISISALPMTPVGSSAQSPRNGFSRRVHYTATARGWTDDPAVFETGGANSQPASIQRRPTPRQSDILIAVSDFVMDGGSAVRPVAARYRGTVVVTLAPTS